MVLYQIFTSIDSSLDFVFSLILDQILTFISSELDFHFHGSHPIVTSAPPSLGFSVKSPILFRKKITTKYIVFQCTQKFYWVKIKNNFISYFFRFNLQEILRFYKNLKEHCCVNIFTLFRGTTLSIFLKSLSPTQRPYFWT